MSVQIDLNDVEIAKVIELKNKGLSYKKIIEMTGCSEWTIRKYCNNNGLSTKEQNQKIKQQIEDLYKEGYSRKDIAKITSKSYSYVQTCLFERGYRHQKKPQKIFTDELRTCKFCYKTFVAYGGSNQKFCSAICQKKDGHQRNDVIRKRVKKEAVVDQDITLNKLFKKDKGICKICGLKCDFNSIKYVNGKKCSSIYYPTIDHIIPLSKGGLHSWNNIQLAHLSCNSSKGAS